MVTGETRETRPVRVARGPAARTRRSLRPPGLPWILPALVLCVGLIYYCIAYTGYISTLNWDGVSPNPPSVGLGNYQRMVGDPVFWAAIWHTAVYFLITFVAQTILGLTFAVILHSRVRLGILYRVVVFVPVVLAPATMAPVFREMFAAGGQLNFVLHHAGLGFLAQPWIGQKSTALPALMFITVWEWTGLTFVLYYAAMSQIDQSVLEAARLDGAGNLRTLISVIWPGVRGTTVALAILSLIGALKTFDIPWLVTIAGPDYATEFLGTYIYQMTTQLDHLGYAAALSVLLLILAMVLAIVVRVLGSEREAA